MQRIRTYFLAQVHKLYRLKRFERLIIYLILGTYFGIKVNQVLSKSEINSCAKFKKLKFVKTLQKQDKTGQKTVKLVEKSGETQVLKEFILKEFQLKSYMQNTVFGFDRVQNDVKMLKNFKIGKKKSKNVEKHVFTPELLSVCEDLYGEFPRIRYLVKHVNGFNLCNNKDLTATQQIKCVNQDFLLKFIHRNFGGDTDSRNFVFRKMLSSVVCGFSELFERGVFLEDISGSNFMFDAAENVVKIVDTDSLRYLDVESGQETGPESGQNSSQKSNFTTKNCESHEDCSFTFKTNQYWGDRSLNTQLASKCTDFNGFCGKNKTCSSIEALQSCMIGHWFLWEFENVWPNRANEKEKYDFYHSMAVGMTHGDPFKRLTFSQVCHRMVV